MPSCDRAVSKHWYPLWTPSPATGRLGLPIKTSHWDHLSTCTFFKPFSGPSYQTKASWVQTSRNSTAESVNQRYQTACLPRGVKGRDLNILMIILIHSCTGVSNQPSLPDVANINGSSAWSISMVEPPTHWMGNDFTTSCQYEQSVDVYIEWAWGSSSRIIKDFNIFLQTVLSDVL